MTLTDRQNQFYRRIAECSASSLVSDKERKYLLRTKNEIENKVKFQDTINAFNFSLRALEKKQDLTPEVRKLRDDLVSVYGQPDYRMLNVMGKEIWKITPSTGNVTVTQVEQVEEGKKKYRIFYWIIYIFLLGVLIFWTVWIFFRMFL